MLYHIYSHLADRTEINVCATTSRRDCGSCQFTRLSICSPTSNRLQTRENNINTNIRAFIIIIFFVRLSRYCGGTCLWNYLDISGVLTSNSSHQHYIYIHITSQISSLNNSNILSLCALIACGKNYTVV